jgi:outer membrane biosynthesis protein TonB
MKTGLTVSTVGHAAALLWALVSFGAKPHDAPPPDSMPVDIISISDFTQLTSGAKAAPKAPVPKPLVEKVAEAKPVENPAAKVSDKPEITTAFAPAEVPPEPKVSEPKPEAKPAKTEAKPSEAEKKPDPKPDTEALKKDESKKPEPKKDEAKATAPKKPPQPPQPKFDPKQIEQRLALLDKRAPQRHAAAGDVLSSQPTLGSPTGNAPKLSQNELEVLKARLAACWNLPAGALDSKDLNVEVQMLLKKDGSLSAEPKVLNRSANPFFQVAAESALRAIRTCAPFDFLPVAKYESWKDLEINFNPQYMFRS